MAFNLGVSSEQVHPNCPFLRGQIISVHCMKITKWLYHFEDPHQKEGVRGKLSTDGGPTHSPSGQHTGGKLIRYRQVVRDPRALTPEDKSHSSIRLELLVGWAMFQDILHELWLLD